jgi:hypothetical protein
MRELTEGMRGDGGEAGWWRRRLRRNLSLALNTQAELLTARADDDDLPDCTDRDSVPATSWQVSSKEEGLEATETTWVVEEHRGDRSGALDGLADSCSASVVEVALNVGDVRPGQHLVNCGLPVTTGNRKSMS